MDTLDEGWEVRLFQADTFGLKKSGPSFGAALCIFPWPAVTGRAAQGCGAGVGKTQHCPRPPWGGWHYNPHSL